MSKPFRDLSITDAVRSGLVVVFCARCGWKLIDCSPSIMRDKCPVCHEYGLDAIVPGIGKMEAA